MRKINVSNDSDLKLGEAVEVPVGVHQLDHVHGHQGDLRGNCQPEFYIYT